jgi:putative FmdB family regulatory protein
MTYEVRCNACEKEFKYQAPITHAKEDVPSCPHCGKQGDVTRLITQEKTSSFVLKGNSWAKKGGY